MRTQAVDSEGREDVKVLLDVIVEKQIEEQ